MLNAFECLGLPPAFDLDMAVLEKAYFALQREHHPDKANQGDSRIASLLTSMQINEAYQTLKSPLSRARHLLKLQGFDVASDKGVRPQMEILEESMEQRERLAEAATLEELKGLEQEAREKREKCVAALSLLCGNEAWPLAAQEALRLGYLEKLLEECRQKRVKLSA